MGNGLKATKAALGALLLVGACTGNIQSPGTTPAPGPNATSRQCPTVPTTIPADARPGMRFTNVALTCGGAGGMLLSISTAPGGATRFVATLADGSVFDAVARPVDGFGNDVPPTTGVHITFGLQYTGDQGEEQNAARSACITQSKAVFTQFETGNPLISAFEGTIKNSIHQKLDDSVIQMLYSITPGRCARWRQMP